MTHAKETIECYTKNDDAVFSALGTKIDFATKRGKTRLVMFQRRNNLLEMLPFKRLEGFVHVERGAALAFLGRGAATRDPSATQSLLPNVANSSIFTPCKQ